MRLCWRVRLFFRSCVPSSVQSIERSIDRRVTVSNMLIESNSNLSTRWRYSWLLHSVRAQVAHVQLYLTFLFIFTFNSNKDVYRIFINYLFFRFLLPQELSQPDQLNPLKLFPPWLRPRSSGGLFQRLSVRYFSLLRSFCLCIGAGKRARQRLRSNPTPYGCWRLTGEG